MQPIDENSSLGAILFARLQLRAARRLLSLALACEGLAKILRETAIALAEAVQLKMEKGVGHDNHPA